MGPRSGGAHAPGMANSISTEHACDIFDMWCVLNPEISQEPIPILLGRRPSALPETGAADRRTRRSAHFELAGPLIDLDSVSVSSSQ